MLAVIRLVDRDHFVLGFMSGAFEQPRIEFELASQRPLVYGALCSANHLTGNSIKLDILLGVDGVF